MGDFILKYWVEFALGVIATGLGIFCRRIWKMYIQEKERKRSAEHEELKSDLTEIMQRYGAYNAVNMDGGSSTTMVINDKLVNSPCEPQYKGQDYIKSAWILK